MMPLVTSCCYLTDVSRRQLRTTVHLEIRPMGPRILRKVVAFCKTAGTVFAGLSQEECHHDSTLCILTILEQASTFLLLEIALPSELIPDVLAAANKTLEDRTIVSQRVWLRHARLELIADSPRREEKQRNHRSFPHLRIVMRSWSRRGPASCLPPLHPLQFGRLINLYHAIDLTVWMSMVLARILLFAVHVDSRDAEEAALRCWQRNPPPAVLRSIEFGLRNPALVESLPDQATEVVVVGVTWAVVLVQSGFQDMAWCSAMGENAF